MHGYVDLEDINLTATTETMLNRSTKIQHYIQSCLSQTTLSSDSPLPLASRPLVAAMPLAGTGQSYSPPAQTYHLPASVYTSSQSYTTPVNA